MKLSDEFCFFHKKIQHFAKRLAESGRVFRSCFLELFNNNIIYLSSHGNKMKTRSIEIFSLFILALLIAIT